MIVAAVNWHTFFFMLFALLACGFALATVFSRNVVRMAFYLMLSLGATAGIFFLAGADFVGAMQLMIYVGGTMVLLIFGVMLTSQEALVAMKTRGADWVLAAVVGGALLFLLVQTAFSVDSWKQARPDQNTVAAEETRMAVPIGVGLLGVRVDQTQDADGAVQPGLSGYLLPFEIVSIHLVVVLIGAAYLARSKQRAAAKRNNSNQQDSPQPPEGADSEVDK